MNEHVNRSAFLKCAAAAGTAVACRADAWLAAAPDPKQCAMAVWFAHNSLILGQTRLGSAWPNASFCRTSAHWLPNDETDCIMVASQPVVRVAPGIPMRYQSKNWDFGWLMLRSDGAVNLWLCDPYTLKFRKCRQRHAIRWLVG